MYKYRMATPGPTSSPSNIRLAGARDLIHHRASHMKELMERINPKLKNIFQTKNDVYTISCSGTGGMEASVTNSFDKNDKVLVLSNGYFGERFRTICEHNALNTLVYEKEWGAEFSLAEVAEIYKENPDLKGVFVVFSETSTGMINPVKEIAALFKKTEVLVVVDAISGLIVNELLMDEWGLDIVIAASHKGFMMAPGLTFVGISDKAWSKIDQTNSSAYYFSFTRLKQFFPFASASASVSLLLSLEESLSMIEDIGSGTLLVQQKQIALAAQRALNALGFILFVDKPIYRSNAVTSALAPEGIDTQKLLSQLETEFNLSITGGQGIFKGKMIRVGHIGYIDELDLYAVFGAIERALIQLGAEFPLGVSSKAIQEVFVRGGK
ncbi:pyridoxal-phosphate-dependent aminotransferase family protein [Enterococcus quebecensis]|nr:alanine--glyoxylate aminotransferase family protein [Enterococcus quebecensis]